MTFYINALQKIHIKIKTNQPLKTKVLIPFLTIKSYKIVLSLYKIIPQIIP